MKKRILYGVPACGAGLAVLAAALLGAGLIVLHGSTTPVLTADAYYYLSKAENLVAGRGLTTYWNDGIDRKFFPVHSIVLAPFSLLKPIFEDYWLAPEVLYYVLTAVVLALLALRVERSRPVAFFAILFWLANPNVLLWHSVPYSEGLATLLMWSAVLACARGWRSCTAGRFAFAASLAGLAMATRAEAGLLAPFFIGVVVRTAWREGISAVPWRRLLLGAALFVLPMFVWWLTLPSSAGEARLSYIAEFRERFAWGQLRYNFEVLFSSVLFERNLRLPSSWMQLTMIVGSRLYLVGIGLALAGALGRRGRWACLLFLGYQALHAFWHYAYGRFNLLLLPLAVYVLALALRWVFTAWWRTTAAVGVVLMGDVISGFGWHAPEIAWALMIAGGLLLGTADHWGPWLFSEVFGADDEDPRAVEKQGRDPRLSVPSPQFLGFALMAALVLVMGSLGHYAIARHKQFLARDDRRIPVREARVEAIVARIGSDRGFLVDVDFPLAYRVGSLTGQRVWFSKGLKDFFPGAFEPSEMAAFLREKHIGYILSPHAKEKWGKPYDVPLEVKRQLVLEKRLPGAELLKLES